MKKLYVSLLIVLTLWLTRHNRIMAIVQERQDFIDCVPPVENNFTTMILRPNKLRCPQSNCWESQMALGPKFLISVWYNQFRQNIAVKTGFKTIYQTLWHWVLEKEAISVAKECPEEKSAVITTRDIYGLGFNMACEETISHLMVKTVYDLLSHWMSFMKDTENDPLNNFDDNGRFRRPSAAYFGCSFVSAKSHGTLVCIYCTHASNDSHNPIEQLSAQCPPKMALNVSKDVPNLCAPKAKYLNHLYSCGDEDAVKQFCGEKPKNQLFANTNDTDVIRYFYPILRGSESTYLVLNKDNSLDQFKSTILYCADLGECPPILPKWTYAYNQTMVKILDDIVMHHKGEHLRYGNNNVIVMINQDDQKLYVKADCCSYIFVSFILMFLIVSALTYFTYKHSKINV